MATNILKDEGIRKKLAKYIVLNAFRNNTTLEDLHAGIAPSTKNKFADVKVKTPYGEIPWKRLSRFSDKEMKKLMIGCVDNMYTILTALSNENYAKHLIKNLSQIQVQPEWDEPKLMKLYHD